MAHCRKKVNMYIGQSIKVKVIRSDNQVPVQEDFKVHSMYPKFVVLDNGIFRVCAFLRDIKIGLPVRI